jgi:transcriptional antiterminator RfaH
MELFSSQSEWYVLHCRPQRESQVAASVPNQLGLSVYLPAVTRQLRGRVRQAPLFPGYLFVKAKLQGNALRAMQAMPGVLQLLAFGGLPQPVPEAVIDALREQVERFNAQGGLPEHKFYPGAAVRLVAGPLQGLEAVFVGPMRPSERVQVLITFLGELREVEVNAADLNAIQPAPARSGERRTRGKGRPIKPRP